MQVIIKFCCIFLTLGHTTFCQSSIISPEKVVTKNLQITENSGLGKILTSDNNGNANWIDISNYRIAVNNQEFPPTFPVKILFQTEVFDSLNVFSNSEFIAPTDGYFYFGANIVFSTPELDSFGTILSIECRDTNNIVKTVASNSIIHDNTVMSQQVTTLLKLNKNDKVMVKLGKNGSKKTIIVTSLPSEISSKAHSYFYGFRVF